MADYTNMLTRAISEAMERMAFMMVGPFDGDLEPPEKTILGKISFVGPRSGDMQVLAGHDFARTVAENMGALEEPDESICADALKELCNVICGLFLPLVARSHAEVFDVTVPDAWMQQDSPTWQRFTNEPDTLVVNVEGYPIAARVTLQNSAAWTAATAGK